MQGRIGLLLCPDAVINAVMYWSVSRLSPHLTRALEGQPGLSGLPEGGRGAGPCRMPMSDASPSRGLRRVELLPPEEVTNHRV